MARESEWLTSCHPTNKWSSWDLTQTWLISKLRHTFPVPYASSNVYICFWRQAALSPTAFQLSLAFSLSTCFHSPYRSQTSTPVVFIPSPPLVEIRFQGSQLHQQPFFGKILNKSSMPMTVLSCQSSLSCSSSQSTHLLLQLHPRSWQVPRYKPEHRFKRHQCKQFNNSVHCWLEGEKICRL